MKRNEVMQTAKTIFSLALTILVMVIIFMLSGQNGEDSGSLSERVSWLLAPMLIPGFDGLGWAEQAGIVDSLAWPIRKTAHASEYFCLALTVLNSAWQISRSRKGIVRDRATLARRVRTLSVASFVVTVMYACTDELHQLFIDGRAGMIADVFVDASGALVAVILGSIVCHAFVSRRGALP